MKIGLIIGNGLSLDFRKHAGEVLADWNPNTPLSWNIPTPGQPGAPLLQHLPHFRDALERIRIKTPMAGDFELLDVIIQDAQKRCGINNALLDETVLEARHFIVNAFSQYQTIVNDLDNQEWQWVHWLQKHCSHLAGAVSFNYDLIFEKALFTAGIKYHRFLTNDNLNRFPVLKPHGSVDFAFRGISAAECDGGPPLLPCYPLQIYVEYPGTRAARMSPDEMLRPRIISGGVILPTETSPYRALGWLRQGYDWWISNASTFTHVVIIGLSYQACDRPELNDLLNAVPSNATAIVIAGNSPNTDMINFLHARFAKVICWEYESLDLT